MRRLRPLVFLVGLSLVWCLPAPSLVPAATESPLPAELDLMLGELRTMSVESVSRVAIGDPDVADVTIMSSSELLIHAKLPGTTSLIVWDRAGQQAVQLDVTDREFNRLGGALAGILAQLHFEDLRVKEEGRKLFVSGQVPSEEEYDRLERLLSRYPEASNLATVAPELPPPPEAPPQSVSLTVQLIEMSRDATDKFGVDWADKLEFTETTFGALGPGGVSRSERLDEAFRLGALTRTGLNPILNMLVSNGKARILAEPKLVAASGKEATAALGVEVPIITATSISSGTVTQNIEFRQTGVELKFQPTVLEDGHTIQLVIDVSVSSVDTSVAITVSSVLVPGFKTRHTQTEIVIDAGETVFISGLIQDEDKENLSQLPGLGSIPVLGNLFRSSEFTHDQTELVIMVTPELTATPEETADRSFALEQALATAEISGSVNDPTLRYALTVQDRIAQAIRYPQREKELGLKGRVKIRLHLFPDGTLGRAVLAESSGIGAFDQEALKIAEQQAPYPPFPSDSGQRELWLEVPVLFRP